MGNFKEYWLEIIFGLTGVMVALATAFVASIETALIIGIVVPVIAVATAIIKLEIQNAVSKAESEVLTVAASSKEVVEKMADMDGIALKQAQRHLDSFLVRVREIHRGEIYLSMSEYFNTALRCLNDHHTGDVIYAINSKGGDRWQADPRQKVYKAANYAAASRGVRINRIFIISKKDIQNESFVELRNVILEHKEKENINIYVVFTELLDSIGMPHDNDWVYVEKPYKKILVDHPDINDPLRGSHAFMYTKNSFIDEKLNTFNQLVQLAEPPNRISKLIEESI